MSEVLEESVDPANQSYGAGETVIKTWTFSSFDIWLLEIAAKTGNLESLFRLTDDSGNTVDRRNTTTQAVAFDRGQLDLSALSDNDITKVELIIDNVSGSSETGDPGASRIKADVEP